MENLDSQLDELTRKIDAIPPTQKIYAQPALRSCIEIIRTALGSQLPGSDPTDLLSSWLSSTSIEPEVIQLSAKDVSIDQVVQLFKLNYHPVSLPWKIAASSALEAPKALKDILRLLTDARYDELSEAACRISIDLILIFCQAYIRDNLPKSELAETSAETPDNPSQATTPKLLPQNPLQSQHLLTVFTEAKLSVELPGDDGDTKIVLNGRADWAVGYNSRLETGNFLVAIEAKQKSELSRGAAQLLAYLAILRENRIRKKKTNITSQGFYSDGRTFVFMSIDNDGTVYESEMYQRRTEDGLNTIYSFIVALLTSAMRSSPTVSPTKPAKQREREIRHYKSDVWLKVYDLLYQYTVPMDEDDRNDNDDWVL
jgi:hypothetical protein